MRLDPDDIRRSLRARRLGNRIECVDETESTNSDVAAAGRSGAPEGSILIADAQTRGRGRVGRAWASPAGVNLYCSVLLRPELPPAEVPLLTLVTGVAVAEAIEDDCDGVSIKWPNDVLLKGRKVAGILLEMDTSSAPFVVVGIGVNINAQEADFPPEVRKIATSMLLATGREHDRAAVAARLLSALDARYEMHLRDGLAVLLPAWSERDALRGRRVQIRVGDSTIEGTAAGLAANGRLQIDTRSGRREIGAGEVSVIDGYRSNTGT